MSDMLLNDDVLPGVRVRIEKNNKIYFINCVPGEKCKFNQYDKVVVKMGKNLIDGYVLREVEIDKEELENYPEEYGIVYPYGK